MKTRFENYEKNGEYKLMDNRVNFNRLNMRKVQFETPKFKSGIVKRKIQFVNSPLKKIEIVKYSSKKKLDVPTNTIFSFKGRNMSKSQIFGRDMPMRGNKRRESESHIRGRDDSEYNFLKRRSCSFSEKIGSIRLVTSLDSLRSLKKHSKSSLLRKKKLKNEKKFRRKIQSELNPPGLKPHKKHLHQTPSTQESPYVMKKMNESCDISFSNDSRRFLSKTANNKVKIKKFSVQVDEESKKLMKQIYTKEFEIKNLKRKIQIASSIDDGRISSNFVNALKNLVENLKIKKNNLIKEIGRVNIGMGKYKKFVGLLKHAKFEKMKKIEKIQKKFLEVKEKKIRIEKLKRESQRLKKNQKRFMDEVQIFRNRLVQNCEKSLREECHLRVMETALNGRFHQEDREIKGLRMKIFELKKRLNEKKKPIVLNLDNN